MCNCRDDIVHELLQHKQGSLRRDEETRRWIPYWDMVRLTCPQCKEEILDPKELDRLDIPNHLREDTGLEKDLAKMTVTAYGCEIDGLSFVLALMRGLPIEEGGDVGNDMQCILNDVLEGALQSGAMKIPHKRGSL